MIQAYATMSRRPRANEEPAGFQKEVYALCQRFGFLPTFCTVTLDDINSLTAMYYAGEVSADVFFDGDLSNLPSRGAHVKIVSKDPFSDSRYFLRMMEVIVREFLGRDSCRGQPVSSCGIFRLTKAFYGVFQSHGRGSLQSHNQGWVHGMPPTVDAVKAAMASSTALKQRFKLWATTFCVTSLPFSEQVVRCPFAAAPCIGVSCPRRRRGLGARIRRSRMWQNATISVKVGE